MAVAINTRMPHRFHNMPSRTALALLAPLVLVLAQASHAANLRFGWDPSSDPAITGYSLSYGTTSGHYTQTVSTGNSSSATVTSLTPGTTYYFVVTAFNGFGLPSLPSNEVSLTLPNNIPPAVSVTSPGAGSSFTTGESIGVSANASDADGSIAKVEFYLDSSKIGESTSAPYFTTWNNAQPGAYVLTALAYDDANTAVRAAGVVVTINSPSAPSDPSTPSSPSTPAAPPTPAAPGFGNVGKVRVAA